MAGWIKMALGMEVGLGPGHVVLDGDPAEPPQCSAIFIVAKQLDASRCHLIRRRDIVLDGDPAPAPLKGHTPNFRPMSVVAKRLDG